MTQPGSGDNGSGGREEFAVAGDGKEQRKPPHVIRQGFLKDRISDRKNNLDFIRFVAAVMVLFSHSWPLTTGSNNTEPLALATRYQLDFGALAVDIFFIVSGFLVTQSFDRSRNVLTFAKARFLRIVPGLFVVIIILALILGPVVTSFSSSQYWGAFPFASLIGDHLPGVFVATPYSGAVDGSLWTIKYEILCYVMVGLLGFLSVLTNRYVMVALWIFSMTPIGTHYSLNLLPFFATGMLYYAFRRYVPIKGGVAVIALFLGVASLLVNESRWVIPLTLGYLILWFAYTPRIRFSGFSRYGDWSYGIYIYAFPVQQMLVQYAGIRQPLVLFAASLPITLLSAALSWHLVEKNALKLKKVPLFPAFLTSSRTGG